MTFAVGPRVTAVIDVSPVTENDFAGTPPNATEVAPVKYWPEIVTVVPLLLAVQAGGFRPATLGGGQSWTRCELPWASSIAIVRKMSLSLSLVGVE